MSVAKNIALLTDLLRRADIEVLGVRAASGSHKKIQCRIGTRTFYMLASPTTAKDVRALRNFTARARRIRRAFDEDPARFEEYIRPR